MHLNLGGLIPIAGGIYCLLLAFGVVRASKDPEINERWLRKFGTLMKILGPCIIVFGLLELFRVL